MKIKVCGMQRPDNISHIESAKPDYFGFIFYPKSKRVVNDQTLSYLRKKKTETKRVGVFVNHDIEDIKSAIIDYGLDAVQLPVSYTHLTLPTNREV